MNAQPPPSSSGLSNDDWHRRLLASLRDCGTQRVRPDPVLNWLLVIGVLAAFAVITLVGRRLIDEGFPSPGPGQPRQAPAIVQLLWLAFNVFVLIRIRNKFLRRGWQVSAYSAEEKLMRAGGQRPILYLRSFQLDQRIGRPGWIERIFGTVPLRSAEQGLAKMLDKCGPVIAIGRPDEKLPPLGAARFYVSHDRWQAKVADVAAVSHFVVWATGTTEGLRWEIAHLIASVPPEKIIIWAHPHLLSMWEGDPEVEWSKFRTLLGGLFPKPLPEVLGPARFIYFTSDWEPRLATPPSAGWPALLRVIFGGQDLALAALLCVKDDTVKEDAIFAEANTATAGAGGIGELVGAGPYGAAWKKVAGVLFEDMASYFPWTERFRRAHPILATLWWLGQAPAGLLLFVAGGFGLLMESGRLTRLGSYPGEKLFILTAGVTGLLVGARWSVLSLLRLRGRTPSTVAGPQLSAQASKALEELAQQEKRRRFRFYAIGQLLLGGLWLATTGFFIVEQLFERPAVDRSDSWETFLEVVGVLVAVAVSVRWLVLGVSGLLGRVASARLTWGAALAAALAVAVSLPVAGQWYRQAAANRRAEELLRLTNEVQDESKLRSLLDEINRLHADDPRFQKAREALQAKLLPLDFPYMSPAEKAKHPQVFLEHMKRLEKLAAQGDEQWKASVEQGKVKLVRDMEPFLAGNPELAAIIRKIQEMIGQPIRLDKLQIDLDDPLISFTSDGSALSVLSREKGVVAVVGVQGDKTFGKEQQRIAGLDPPLVLSVPGNRVAGYDRASRKIVVKEIASGKQLAALEGFQSSDPRFLRFSPDESLLAASGFDLVGGRQNNKLQVWDLSTAKIKAAVGNLDRLAADAAISADGKALASVEDQDFGHAMIWELTNPLKVLWKMGPENHDKRIALSPDGQWCARGTTGFGQLLVNNPALQMFMSINRPAFDPERAFSPDGKLLACEADFQGNSFIKYWDLGTKQPVFSQPMGFGSADPKKFRLHYDPRRTLLATCGNDGSDQVLSLWDVGTGKQTGPPANLGPAEVQSLAISSDGQVAAVAQKGGLLSLWKVPAAR
jgi:WD40 repeat protein